jgi:hypothetical protein
MQLKLYVPVTRNDGTPFESSPLESVILKETGGFTSYRAKGFWQGPASIYSEPVNVLEIYGDPESLEQICDEFFIAGQQHGQEAVFFVKDGVPYCLTCKQ